MTDRQYNNLIKCYICICLMLSALTVYPYITPDVVLVSYMYIQKMTTYNACYNNMTQVLRTRASQPTHCMHCSILCIVDWQTISLLLAHACVFPLFGYKAQEAVSVGNYIRQTCVTTLGYWQVCLMPTLHVCPSY